MWMIIFVALFSIIYSTWDMQDTVTAETISRLDNQDAKQVANGMIVLSNVLGSYLYKNPVDNGQVDTTGLPVPIVIDRRIKQTVLSKRLWIYTTEEIPSLTTELQRISTNSALICIVKNGRLQMLNGADMNIALPPDVKEGSVVYLN